VRAAASLALAKEPAPPPEVKKAAAATTPASAPEGPVDVGLDDDEKVKKLKAASTKVSAADFAFAAGDISEALSLYQDAQKLSPQKDIQWLYGECYRRLGDGAKTPEKQVKQWERAKQAYERFAKARPGDPRAKKAALFAEELADKIAAAAPEGGQ
jgi:tetratricopeptide (TPR) repeat protein